MKKADWREISDFLNQKYEYYNTRDFIAADPVSIPHLFTKKEDIEIAGLFAATLAWGNRKSILKNAGTLMEKMDHQPFDFIINHQKKDLKQFETFVHRTFNALDLRFFIEGLRHLYLIHGGLESAFSKDSGGDLKSAIGLFRKRMLEVKHLGRSEKHISDPFRKSSAKRLCMYLRWMVRSDSRGVDFGIWQSLSPSALHLPLDVHTGNVSRQLKLLTRKQNDWQAVEEITAQLRRLDPLDPVKYDFALFGLGVEGYFK
jgi:uncharacterized protein (TIGR02757 family)